MRRSTVLLLAALALVLAACQIRTDYGLLIEADTSAELAFEISYNGEAAELLGPAEGFLEEEIENDIGSTLDGVTLLDASADSSDPEQQRVTALFGVEDGAALDRLVADLFPNSSFSNVSGTTWQLTLRTDEDVAADFGDEEIPFDDIAGEFLAGEVRVGYAGTQVSMQGGTDDGQNEIVWDPYGGEDLELVLDLSGSAPAPAPDEGEPEQPVEDEEPVDEEPATDDPADDEADDEAAGDDEPSPEGEEAQDQAVVTTTDEDDGGLSVLLLAAIAGGALLLLLILLLVLRGRRGKGSDELQPVGAGPDQGGWAPPAPAAPQQSWGGPPPSSTAPTQPMPPSGPAGSPPPPGPAAPPPPPPGTPPPPPSG